MPTKTTESGREYEIDGRRLTWHADTDPEFGEEPFDVVLPLRIKLKLIEAVGAGQDLNADTMLKMLDLLVPNERENLREMDVNDFQEMFMTWQSEYEQLTGASLGESSGSSDSSASTEPQSGSTSVTVSG